jgi:DNA-binding NtrC family response regulator
MSLPLPQQRSLKAMSPKPIRVLLVDDHPDTLEWMNLLLETRGYLVQTATDGAASEQLRDSWKPQLVLMDSKLPDVDGTELLTRFKQAGSSAEIIMITGHGSVSLAVDAMKAGAYSFIEKPVDPDVLLAVMEKALERSVLSEENQRLREQLQHHAGFANIVSTGTKMGRLFQLMSLVAPTDANVLIHGESGTGKELVASAIHEHSKRANGPFVKINCAAVPAELMESELFGHKKGAFTGAVSDKVGLVELASGGSLLLDEIGEMAPQLQVKLLRLLQEREFRPIGSTRVVRADFRLICATNASLDPSTRKIREDLYFRINTITLDIPPLRDRPEDIPLLCEHFLKMFAKRHERDVRSIHPVAQEALLRHSWPGNVRELEHVVERAVIVAEGSEIVLNDLPDIMDQPALGQAPTADHAQLTLAEIERQAILRTLERTNGNKRAAASILGVYRPTLYGKLRKYKLGEYSATPKAKKTRAPEAGTPDEAGGTEAQREAAERRPRTPQGPPRP